MGFHQRQFMVYAGIAVVLLVGLSACSPVVFVPDQGLEAAIRQEIRKPLSLFLTRADLEKITTLNAASMNVNRLDGLQYCTNLRKINLNDNNVRNIDALAPLTKLTHVHLRGNRVVEIEALAGLLHLETLDLSGVDNVVADWKALQDNVLNGGLGAGDVVLLSALNTLDAQDVPLPSFAAAYNTLLQEGVVVEFLD
jgi:hypothetical protein